MKIKLFPLALTLIVFFAACTKDSGGGDPDYFVKADVAGSEKTYVSVPVAVHLNQNGVDILSMSAGANEGFGLQITLSGAIIGPGTYTQTSTGNPIVAGIYNPGTIDPAGVYGAGGNFNTTAPLQVIISALTSAEVSGTFSGMYYDESGLGNDSLLITNGSFRLPLQ